MHALRARRRARDDPAAAELPAAGRRGHATCCWPGASASPRSPTWRAALRTSKADYRLVYVGRSRDRDGLPRRTGGAARRPAAWCTSTTRARSLRGRASWSRRPPPDTELYMCGPIRLMDAVRRSWADRRAGPCQPALRDVRQQRLVRARGVHVASPAAGRRDDRPARGQSMLEALEAAGVDMMFDCRKGECGLCQVAGPRARRRRSTTATCSTANASRTRPRRCAAASPAPSPRRRRSTGAGRPRRARIAIDVS